MRQLPRFSGPQGREPAGLDDGLLSALAQALQQLGQQVQVFSRSGWLLHMACDTAMKTRMEAGHKEVVDLLKVGGLGCSGLWKWVRSWSILKDCWEVDPDDR